MAQHQLPDGTVVDESGGRHNQLPDGSLLSESPNVFDVAISEAASATDTVVGASPVEADIAESVAAADSVATAVAWSKAVAEAAAAADRVSTIFVSGNMPQPNTVAERRRSPHLYLTDDFPVTMTTELGAFAEELPVPDRYGDLRRSRFRLLRMTSTLFVAARHPMEITRTFTGDLETKSFEARTEALGGHSCTVVEFAAPVPIGTEATASGLGKRNEVTGELIENPADILADIMALADRDDRWWDQLRAEASVAGIRLAGSFSAKGSIRDRIDAVIDSCGAIWCPGMARLYPAPIDGFRIDLDRYTVADLSVSASPVDTADILRVAFGYDEAEQKNQSFITLEASPVRYGGTIADIALPWLQSAASAEAVGRRLLSRLSSVRCSATFSTPLTEFTRPGTWAVLSDHPEWPFDGSANLMFATALRNRKDGSARITAEAIVSDEPTITLTKHSLGSDTIGAGGVEVEFRNGVATLTVLDNSDKPLSGAYVSLDGEAPKKTNAQGQVSFVAAAGPHELAIEADGYVPFTIEITL